MLNERELLQRQLEREKQARKQAEALLEAKSLALFYTNQNLQEAYNKLEQRVQERTAELVKVNDILQAEIIERKRIEERQARLLKELESANLELNDFAYVVSHDLKAPLRAIGSLSSWIAEDYADKLDDDGKEHLTLLLGRVKRMHDLIEGILQYSRVGRIREERTLVDLNTLVEDVITLIAPPAHIEVTVATPLPTIVCEQTRLGQVFQNLLSNAIKFMDKPHGKVTIGCVGEDGQWQFRVADNGPGIEAKHFDKIFQIFQTLSPRDEFESTGIGLTVAKKIVELHRGRIWVESTVGCGTTFFFTLPQPDGPGLQPSTIS